MSNLKLACFLSFTFLFSEIINGQKEYTSFTIGKLTQNIKFEQVDGELHGTIESEEGVYSNEFIPKYYRKYMIFDSQSEIEKIYINGTKTKPVISNDLPTNEIFHSDSKYAYIEHQISNNKKMTKIEVVKKMKNYRFFDLIKFQNTNYSTKSSEINITIPTWLEVEIKEFNFEGKNITKTIKDGIITYKSSEFPIDNPENNQPDKRKYQPHILFIFKSMMVGNNKVTLIPDLDNLYGWYKSMTEKIGNDRNAVKQKALELTQNLTTDEDKIKAIFYYVQDNIKYLAFEHGIMGFQPESCQLVYGNKFGDCKGMANLTKEMLCALGFDARLTWIGTNDIPYDYSIPSLYVDNHMICTVLHDGKEIFLDATEKKMNYGYMADRIQGRQVLIEDGKKYRLSKIPIQDGNHHFFEGKHNYTIVGENISGEGTNIYKGNIKSRLLNLISSTSYKNKTEVLKYIVDKGDKNLSAQLKSEIDTEQKNPELKIEYNLTASNQIIKSGKEWYVNLDFENYYSDSKPEKDRNCPYELGQKYLIKTESNLTLPQGFSLKYIPAGLEISNEIGHFSLKYENAGNKIIYKRKIELLKNEIGVKELDKWNLLRQQLEDFYSDRIIIESK